MAGLKNIFKRSPKQDPAPPPPPPYSSTPPGHHHITAADGIPENAKKFLINRVNARVKCTDFYIRGILRVDPLFNVQAVEGELKTACIAAGTLVLRESLGDLVDANPGYRQNQIERVENQISDIIRKVTASVAHLQNTGKLHPAHQAVRVIFELVRGLDYHVYDQYKGEKDRIKPYVLSGIAADRMSAFIYRTVADIFDQRLRHGYDTIEAVP